MPLGKVYHFRGRPNFTISSPHAGTVTRFIHRGIGEVQSPLWRRKESKTAALSQVGIYVVGQFTKEEASGSCPAVVAMANLVNGQTSATNTLGTTIFKLVGQVDPIDLKDANDLRTFSGLLNGAISMSSTR